MSPLERFVRGVVGPCEVVRRHRTTGPKRVLEVRDEAGERWFGMRMHLPRLWRGELDGYTWWQEHPATPRLRAHDPELRAMVVSAVPGQPASPDVPETFEAAGALLRELHDARPSVTDHAWLGRARVSARFERKRADHAGRAVDVAAIERALAGMEDLAAAPEAACRPAHGDFLPHNWLQDSAGGLHTLDFAEAGLRPVTHDLARVRFGPCWQRPELWSAFLRGWGRELTDVEHRLLGHQLALNATVAVGWGSTHDRPEVRERGMDALRRLDPETGEVAPPGRRGSRRRDHWRAALGRARR